MAYLRFYRRLPIIPGLIYLNVSKSGLSLSFGKRGMKMTIGKKGARYTVGLPGTGLFLTEHQNKKRNIQDRKVNIKTQDFIGVENGKTEAE